MDEQKLKSLADVFKERRVYYKTLLSDTLDSVYETKNVIQIAQFEKGIIALSKSVSGLEAKLPPSEEGPNKIHGKYPNQYDSSGRRKPRLTRYQYIKSRDAGMTNGEIKKKFRYESGRELSAFGMHYSVHCKKKKQKN